MTGWTANSSTLRASDGLAIRPTRKMMSDSESQVTGSADEVFHFAHGVLHADH